ncbi:uncharacterized protein LOC119684615 [Teleopsis dalmanni]|uniref:uncharacterized protein LOC119684615 n=1 Tax=Teleopsis dalmanni TaxID=139649 RepID=UPI0018CFD33B|nr:uncharacterized protein LOC119684615 [Teleopsis dalmanni]
MSVNGGIIICDGELEIVRITEDLYDKTLNLFQNSFMKYENVSIATNLCGSQQTMDEMEILLKSILKDGVSFCAIHRETKEVVAMAANKFICPSANIGLDDVLESFKSKEMRWVSNYLCTMETTFDLFKEWNVDCVVEIVFLSTHINFGKRGLAATISKYSIDFFKQLGNCTLTDVNSLPAHVRSLKPEAISSTFTSKFSQKVGEKLGFTTVYKVANKDFVYEGKTYAELIDPIHEFSTFAAIRL